MDWIVNLFSNHESVAYTVIIYSIVIALGVALGKIRFWGISFGIACVLFAGIAVAHFGFTVDGHIQHFVKEFGLILFVYTIGLQVGPGFFASFQQGGLKLNSLAILSAIACVLTVIGLHYATGTGMAELVGIMSGAVTNTPGLGAAQQAIVDISLERGLSQEAINDTLSNVSNGYAVAYPFGVLGIILVMMVLKYALKVNLDAEKRLNRWKINKNNSTVDKIAVYVENPILFNKHIAIIKQTLGMDFVISRLYRDDNILLVDKDTFLKEGDILLLVANPKDFERLSTLVGKKANLSLFDEEATNIISRRMNVTNKQAYTKKLGEINVREKYGVTISRVYRAGIEFVPTKDTKLQFGDTITVVGDEEHIKLIEKVFGNSKKRLQHPHIAELFFGIVLGVILGSIPIYIPGMSSPVKLGLAGGPLIVAILISRYGGRFSVTHYVSHSANLMVREIGIVLFLASVGLGAGQGFIKTLSEGAGFQWMLMGVAITLIPLIIVALTARFYFKLNFLEICGLLSGSQTDPPALAFAHDVTGSDAPAVTYAAVYPLTTFMRIMVAQLLIVLFL
ncbi:putative transporter [Capnocytophaga stomatis]|uniref:Potassium transporter TrkA n=1 Tax=Capnocytophaga stomatis TaxID=1848904 RepID=A0A250FX86_9FLAO|nr:putative transporter [Capnocytophaga stomatis]ATA88698.1 potassium transporter TrkA [Capnocytophaga stomatis]GIJ93476.1 putative transporter [Capnocytophaga stomatis]